MEFPFRRHQHGYPSWPTLPRKAVFSASIETYVVKAVLAPASFSTATYCLHVVMAGNVQGVYYRAGPGR